MLLTRHHNLDKQLNALFQFYGLEAEQLFSPKALKQMSLAGGKMTEMQPAIIQLTNAIKLFVNELRRYLSSLYLHKFAQVSDLP